MNNVKRFAMVMALLFFAEVFAIQCVMTGNYILRQAETRMEIHAMESDGWVRTKHLTVDYPDYPPPDMPREPNYVEHRNYNEEWREFDGSWWLKKVPIPEV